MADQLTLIRRRIEQHGDLGFGQLLSSHRRRLPAFLASGSIPCGNLR
jgi:hypothetical protein